MPLAITVTRRVFPGSVLAFMSRPPKATRPLVSSPAALRDEHAHERQPVLSVKAGGDPLQHQGVELLGPDGDDGFRGEHKLPRACLTC